MPLRGDQNGENSFLVRSLRYRALVAVGKEGVHVHHFRVVFNKGIVPVEGASVELQVVSIAMRFGQTGIFARIHNSYRFNLHNPRGLALALYLHQADPCEQCLCRSGVVEIKGKGPERGQQPCLVPAVGRAALSEGGEKYRTRYQRCPGPSVAC